MSNQLLFFVSCFVVTATLLGRAGTRGRKVLLAALSMYFIWIFGWQSLAGVLLLSALNFWLGRFRSVSCQWFAVSLNLASIFFFSAFALTALRDPGGKNFVLHGLPLLVGLSFYSLQHIAYQVDVAKRRLEAERNFLDFLLFSIYFPKFLAGPITLYQDLKPQLDSRPNQRRIFSGVNRMLLGLFKKLVLAERLAPAVASVFEYQDQLPGLTILSGAAIFSIQLYFDFSGYSDLAIGASRILGIELPENFSMPFRSCSLTYFWRRWHMSLLRFFTDYVYFPFVFRLRRWGRAGALSGIVLVFILSGIWHGVGLTFLCWALCHALFMGSELYIGAAVDSREKARLPIKLLWALMVFMLFTVSNVFFRSPDMSSCLDLWSQIFASGFVPSDWLLQFIAPLAVGGHQVDRFNFYISIFFPLTFLLLEAKLNREFDRDRFRPLSVYLILLLVFVFAVFGNTERFIYMQF